MDDIPAFMNGRNKEFVDLAEKVLEKLKIERKEKGLKLSITQGGKEGKNKVITSCGYLKERFRKCSEKGVVMATSVETLGLDLRTRTKQVGAKEKARRKQGQEKESLSERFHEDWCEKVAMDALGPCECVGRPGSWNGAYGEAPVEETNGSSRQKWNCRIWKLKRYSTMATMPTMAWAEGSWMGKWTTEQTEAWMKQIFEVQAWRGSATLIWADGAWMEKTTAEGVEEATLSGADLETSERPHRSRHVRDPRFWASKGHTGTP